MIAKNVRLNLFILTLLFFTRPAFGEDQAQPPAEVQVIKSEEITRTRLGVLAGISHFSYGGSINSIGIGVTFLYALNDRFGLKTSFQQNFNISGFSALSSNLDLRLEYALTGTLISRKDVYAMGGSEVLTNETLHEGGIRLSAQSDLSFFNSKVSVIPFTGFGAGVNYEFPSRSSTSYEMGLRADFLSSSKVDIAPIQVSLGVLFQ